VWSTPRARRRRVLVATGQISTHAGSMLAETRASTTARPRSAPSSWHTRLHAVYLPARTASRSSPSYEPNLTLRDHPRRLRRHAGHPSASASKGPTVVPQRGQNACGASGSHPTRAAASRQDTAETPSHDVSASRSHVQRVSLVMTGSGDVAIPSGASSAGSTAAGNGGHTNVPSGRARPVARSKALSSRVLLSGKVCPPKSAIARPTAHGPAGHARVCGRPVPSRVRPTVASVLAAPAT
jgi:hypothetical protein